ncbi:MAG: hypothetical protein ACLUIW_06165 [Dysosmobacter welbionis]
MGTNPDNLVFTDPSGKHLTKPTVYRAFKKAVASIGRPDARFHDLRHSYAVAALRSGDDVTQSEQSRTCHGSLHSDVYGHVTDKMKQESAARWRNLSRASRKDKGSNRNGSGRAVKGKLKGKPLGNYEKIPRTVAALGIFFGGDTRI